MRLPIESVLPHIVTAVQAGRDVILKSSPGSGKTTRVPPALLSILPGQIWVLEPRRLAARLSAQRIADELGQAPGQLVGWHMRFDRLVTTETRLVFLTEGMFAHRLLENPTLDGVSCVVLDEFHERHQQTDVAFALCRKIQSQHRPDLRLVVMSATLDESELKAAMPNAEVIVAQVAQHPVSVDYWRGDYTTSLVDRTVDGILSFVRMAHGGHILVFLPGTAEILKVKQKLSASLRSSTNDWIVLELRGSLDKEEQDRVFSNSPSATQSDAYTPRKIILATNIAESSITIPGVTAVVDSGLAKVPIYNFFSGVSTLATKPVSLASLIQRTGRAGRTSPGFALRLFSKQDEAARPAVDIPEILRLDLPGIYLSLLGIAREYAKQKTVRIALQKTVRIALQKTVRIALQKTVRIALQKTVRKNDDSWHPASLPWLTAPDDKQWLDAKILLQRLKFIDQAGDLIVDASAQANRSIHHLPVHPRIARFASSCLKAGYQAETPWLVAILEDESSLGQVQNTGASRYEHLGCDLLAAYDYLRSSIRIPPQMARTADQIARRLGQKKLRPIAEGRPAHELDLAIPLLDAYPDRVIFKSATKNTVSFCLGGDATLSSDSAAGHSAWLIALDLKAQTVSGSQQHLSGRPSSSHVNQVIGHVTRASGLTADQILQHCANNPQALLTLLKTEDVVEWDERHGKSRTIRRQLYGQLVLTSQVLNHVKNETESLLAQLKKQWPKPFPSSEPFDSYLIRQHLAKSVGLIHHAWDHQELLALLLMQIADSAESFDAIAERSLEDWLRDCVGYQEYDTLEKYAPSTLVIGKGLKVKVHYTEAAPPWIEARLQNFFGMGSTPKILDGRVALTLHLLAPNMRALQVTKDLTSFWSGAYPALRTEYMRKYPRHSWPDNPWLAEPPPLHKKRN